MSPAYIIRMPYEGSPLMHVFNIVHSMTYPHHYIPRVMLRYCNGHPFQVDLSLLQFIHV